jgi:endonuclease III
VTKKQRAKLVQSILNQYFPNPPIPLRHSDPYTLLISVLLSAQCTDVRVNQITPLLFAKANTPQEMIKLTIKEIVSIIRPCGLSPKKGAAIWNLSKMIVEQHQGNVPQNFFDLEAFPGVGHKTASVVMSQAFKKPAFPIDTHIHRCATRWKLTSGKNVKQTEEDLKYLFPKNSWNALHLQIIYFARKYCPARQHSVEACPICSQI